MFCSARLSLTGMAVVRTVILIAATVCACCGAEIRIRVIKSKNARPKAAVALQVYLFDDAGPRLRQLIPGTRRTQTDDTGVAVVDIPVVRQRSIAISLQDGCSPGEYSLEEILRTGIVGKNGCWHNSPELKKIVPTPGEIIVFADQLNLFERIKHRELWP